MDLRHRFATPAWSAAALLACLLAAGSAWAGQAGAAAWPVIALPSDARPFEIGEQLTVNGKPMRVRGFLAGSDPARLAQWFRQRLGKPLVEDVVGGRQVLGQAQGEYYVTVQLERAGSGTRGLVAVTHMKSALQNQAGAELDKARILSAFPLGSHLINHIASYDGGKSSTYVVIANSYDEDLNVERVKDMMAADGMAVERESRGDALAGAARAQAGSTGRSIFFRGAQKEAVAVVARDASGQTSVVFNTITSIGEHQ